jgi:hypothetical protein
MIYDSPEQKQFILEAIKKYPCNYENALQLANNFGQAIQDGRVVPVKQQLEAIPLPKPKAAQVEPNLVEPNAGGSGQNGNRKTRRAKKAGKSTTN